jgi:hypothetical protein
MEAFAIPERRDRLADAVDGLVYESIDEFSTHALGEDLIEALGDRLHMDSTRERATSIKSRSRHDARET